MPRPRPSKYSSIGSLVSYYCPRPDCAGIVKKVEMKAFGKHEEKCFCPSCKRYCYYDYKRDCLVTKIPQ